MDISTLKKIKKYIESDTSLVKNLNFRKFGLKPIDIIAITNILKQEKNINHFTIKSISFSYNNLIGDEGATTIAKNLDFSVNEIGLVGCGIGDIGGNEILNWMNNSTNLQMICIEQNNFSSNLKMKFKTFKKNNPKIMVVI